MIEQEKCDVCFAKYRQKKKDTDDWSVSWNLVPVVGLEPI